MKRIKDNYNWKKLRQWKFVLERRTVGWKDISGVELSDKELGQAVELLLQNCFPVAMICSIENGEIKVWATSLWKGIFCFLNTERSIERNGALLSFNDMDVEEKWKILEAEIYSIWIN